MNQTPSDPQGRDDAPVSSALHESPRFAPPATRRDFLGLAAAWTTVIAWVAAAIGALRLPMPAVFPESNSKVKLGPPHQYKTGSATFFPDLSLWLFRDAKGFYAISAVCTHLGCIAARKEDGRFACPCHGSKFNAEGKVTGGPAPTALHWLALSLSPDGQLIVDKQRTVSLGSRFQA